MSKEDFSAEEFAARQRRVRHEMANQEIDLLLVIHPTNIQYLIGTRTKSYQEFQVLLFPLEEGPLTVLCRLAEVAEYTDLSLADEVRGWGGREPEDPVDAFHRLLEDQGCLSQRIGLEVPEFYLHALAYERIKAILAEALVKDASRLIHDLKLVKSPAELVYIREASDIADAAMRSAVDAVSEGVTEMEVAGEVYRTLLSRGSDIPASPMNFVTGERTCYGHGAPSPKKIERGDFMHIEYGAAVNRYAVTIGRHLCLGEPTRRMRELDALVREACDACIAQIRAGVAAVQPHLAAKRVIADAGLDRYRLHTTGYGIAPGYPPSWGEYIHLFADSTYTLQANMMLSVEPPVMIHEEKLGARLIDDVLVTETGAEIMSSYTRDLIVIDP